jgi:hypothetical protein
MKKLLIGTLVLGVSCAVTFGQGALFFSNLGSSPGGLVNAKIFDVDGTTALEGTGFTAQLFYGADGTPAGSLTPLASPVNNFNTGPLAGYFSDSPAVQIPGVANGSTAAIQLKVWSNAGGTITDFDTATVRGQSEVLAITLGDNQNPTTIPRLEGLTSFSLVPEPSTYALLALGAGALLLRRRK